jgi:hypothetical protein
MRIFSACCFALLPKAFSFNLSALKTLSLVGNAPFFFLHIQSAAGLINLQSFVNSSGIIFQTFA